MSNIYIQEPPTSGKVLLKTSAGDIDIELWAKETPKACRNFIQLCLEGYYNATIFHRVVKDFIVQGGDPTGSGEGGESIYGHPFKDEFHTRLRFCRRGLVAMANAGKDDNASQFFFTMGPSQELQNKHTIFGKVTGDTVYNMLKLQEGIVDYNERPQFPQKIVKTLVLENPFPDIVPRSQPSDAKKETKRKREKKSGVKDFKLLSFGEEAEEDEEETERENKRFSGRSKSTHDLLDDPKLSATPAVASNTAEASSESSDLSEDETNSRVAKKVDEGPEEIDRVKSKLISLKKTKKDPIAQPDDDQDIEAYSLGQDERDERKKRTEAIKQEYRELRRNMRKGETSQPIIPAQVEDEKESEVIQEYKKERKEYEHQKNKMPAKGVDRESFTMALLAKFQKKLESVKEQAEHEGGGEDRQEESGQQEEEEDDAALGKDGGKWMGHKLQFDENADVVAKDANTKDQKASDWFEIDDPRNPINQRRRQASKPSGSSKNKIN